VSLADLPNLGPTIVRRLAEIGVKDRKGLARVGPPEAYRRLSAAAGRPLPFCYYLYALEAALRGHDWRMLSNDEKAQLRSAVKRK
jgi:hypothetical protein